MRADHGLPPAFVVGAAAKLAAVTLLGLLVTYAFAERAGELRGWAYETARFGRPLLGAGIGLAVAALFALGFHELARRAGPGFDGTVLRVGAAAVLVIFGAVLAGQYVEHWYLPRARGEDGDAIRRSIEAFWTWQQRVNAAAALVASGALIAAGRRDPLVRALAVPFLIATAFAYPVAMLRDVTDVVSSRDDLWAQLGLDVLIAGSFLGLLLAVAAAVARALPPAAVDLQRASVGLQRVGSGLVARVLVLLVAAFTGVSTFASSSGALAKLMATVFPLAALAANLAIVTGMMQAGGLSAPGAPRKRFYAAAVLTTTAFFVEALKALALYHRLALTPDGPDGYVSAPQLEQAARALPYSTPAMALAGLLCLLWAVDGLRRWAPDADDPRPITSAAVAVSVFTVAAVLTLRWGAGAPDNVGVFVLVAILVAIFNVIAQLAVARVCHRVAEGIRDAPALPTAVARRS